MPIDAGRETVSKLMERWLRDSVAHQTRPRTMESYSMHVRLYIEPVIGEVKLQKPAPATFRRMIHIGETAVRLLHGHGAKQAEYRLKLRGVYEDNGFIFPLPTVGVLDPRNLTASWMRVCRDAGVKCRLHDLRYHHGTALIENGAHIEAVRDRLGQSRPSLAMKIYAHVSPQMDKEAAEAYDRAMAAAD